MQSALPLVASTPALPAACREHARWIYVCAEQDHAISMSVHRAGRRAFITRHETSLSKRDAVEITLRGIVPATSQAMREAIGLIEARLALRGSYYRGRSSDFSLAPLARRTGTPLLPRHPLGHHALFFPYAEEEPRAVRALVSIPAESGRTLLIVKLDHANNYGIQAITVHHASLPAALHFSTIEHIGDMWSGHFHATDPAESPLVPLHAARDVREATGLAWPEFTQRLIASLSAIDGPAPSTSSMGDDEFSQEFSLYPDMLSCPFVQSLFDTYLPNPKVRYELRQETSDRVKNFIARERRKSSASVQHHWTMLEAALLADRARIQNQLQEESAEEQRLMRLLMESGTRPGSRIGE